MVTKCIINFCNTIKSGDGVALHKLPSDAAVQKEWFRAILDETGQTIFSEDDVICSKHFAPSCFTVIDRKPVLNPNAIPFESLQSEGPEPKKIKREKGETVQCSVFSCRNSLGSTDVHRPELVYHPFPKKPDLASKWKIFCSKEDNDFEHSYVCSDHFTASDYREQKRNRGKVLKADAIPTIYKREALIEDQSESDQFSVGSGMTAEPVDAPRAGPTASDMQWIIDDPSKIVWTKSRTTTLIELLKASPPLWDVSCPDYRNRIKRDKCWDNISNTMKVHQTEIKSKVLKLRTQYSNERNKMRKLKSRGGPKEQYITKWEFFFSLNFLFQKEGTQYRNVDSVMWSYIEPTTSEDELEVNQKFYNFKDLEKKVQQYARKNGVHKFKIKSSHNIPANVIKDTEDVSEELANNIRSLRYREILFCCHTFDLNLSKKKLLVDNTNIKQCPAEIKASWIKLSEADEDYVEGYIERALMVTRIVNDHDHEFYEKTLKESTRRKKLTAKNEMSREEKNTSPDLILYSIKAESPETINLIDPSGVNTEVEERDIKVTALFDKFKSIMVHKSTSHEFNDQLHTLQQILEYFQSNANILLPTDVFMRNVSIQNASSVRDNSTTSVTTDNIGSKENIPQNLINFSLEERKNVELTDRTKNMVSDIFPNEPLSVSKLQSDSTVLGRQESLVTCNAGNENGVDVEENEAEVGMEVNMEKSENGVVAQKNETKDTEKKENEVDAEENKNVVDHSDPRIQSIQMCRNGVIPGIKDLESIQVLGKAGAADRPTTLLDSATTITKSVEHHQKAIKFSDRKIEEQVELLISTFLPKFLLQEVMENRKKVELEHLIGLEPGNMSDILGNSEIDLGAILENYFETRALHHFLKLAQEKQENGPWTCAMCHGKLKGKSIMCDSCQLWFDQKCVSAKNAVKDHWFCPNCYN